MQPPGADVFHAIIGEKGDPRDLPDPALGEGKLGALRRDQGLILLGQGVLRLGHDPDEILFGQRLKLHPNREASLQLGDQVRGLGDMKGPRRDEQDVVGPDVAIAGLDRRTFDDRQQVALDSLA